MPETNATRCPVFALRRKWKWTRDKDGVRIMRAIGAERTVEAIRAKVWPDRSWTYWTEGSPARTVADSPGPEPTFALAKRAAEAAVERYDREHPRSTP